MTLVRVGPALPRRRLCSPGLCVPCCLGLRCLCLCFCFGLCFCFCFCLCLRLCFCLCLCFSFSFFFFFCFCFCLRACFSLCLDAGLCIVVSSTCSLNHARGLVLLATLLLPRLLCRRLLLLFLQTARRFALGKLSLNAQNLPLVHELLLKGFKLLDRFLQMI